MIFYRYIYKWKLFYIVHQNLDISIQIILLSSAAVLRAQVSRMSGLGMSNGRLSPRLLSRIQGYSGGAAVRGHWHSTLGLELSNIFHIVWMFPSLGEKLEREEVDILIKECCDPEDDDGFIPYERKFTQFSMI